MAHVVYCALVVGHAQSNLFRQTELNFSKLASPFDDFNQREGMCMIMSWLWAKWVIAKQCGNAVEYRQDLQKVKTICGKRDAHISDAFKGLWNWIFIMPLMWEQLIILTLLFEALPPKTES